MILWTTTSTAEPIWLCNEKGGVCLADVVSGRLTSNRDGVTLKDRNGDTHTFTLPIAEGEELPKTFEEAMRRLNIFRGVA